MATTTSTTEVAIDPELDELAKLFGLQPAELRCVQTEADTLEHRAVMAAVISCQEIAEMRRGISDAFLNAELRDGLQLGLVQGMDADKVVECLQGSIYLLPDDELVHIVRSSLSGADLASLLFDEVWSDCVLQAITGLGIHGEVLFAAATSRVTEDGAPSVPLIFETEEARLISESEDFNFVVVASHRDGEAISLELTLRPDRSDRDSRLLESVFTVIGLDSSELWEEVMDEPPVERVVAGLLVCAETLPEGSRSVRVLPEPFGCER